jgi:DNA-binding NarL/FixJ family response regulator
MKKVSIMLVDDNNTFRESFKLIMSRYEDYEITGEAENGVQALELLDKFVPDLVFMDIQMPEMDGIEATKRMLWRFSFIKFIAITMYNDEAYIYKLLEAGFKGCIFKDNIYDELDGALIQLANNAYFFPEKIKLKN